MAKAKPFKYARRGRPSKADIEARKKAERQELFKMAFAVAGILFILGVIFFSASSSKLSAESTAFYNQSYEQVR
tara:strand:- start:640 stop:861 length:222 start_codon:yes stop_codon:yes gene_type:complete